MPAGAEVLIDGEYKATYGAVDVGMFEGDAGVPTLDYTAHGEEINNTSRYGKARIDGIYTGVDWKAAFLCMEYKAGSISAFYPFGTLGLLGVVGRLYFGMSAALVLTAIAGTPAAATPATLTASKSIVPINFNGRLVYGPTLRKVPIQLNLLPYDTGAGAIGCFTTT